MLCNLPGPPATGRLKGHLLGHDGGLGGLDLGGLASRFGDLASQLYTVVAISIRTSKFRMGLFNDDRLAGQFILRMDLS
jgi:hypothetical protein